MLDLVAEHGYAATTIPSVVAEARVSRNAFYELFEDKQDCFLALCEELTDQLLEATFAPTGAPDWRAAIREGARSYLAWWQEQPQFARAYLVELPAAGAVSREQRQRAYEQFAERFRALARWARQTEPDLAPLRELAIPFTVAAITDIVAEEVAAGRVNELASLEDDLVWLITRMVAEKATVPS
jgi:AcrR family transcriptional regulator